jgi:methyl-accepting chemotaxis protein
MLTKKKYIMNSLKIRTKLLAGFILVAVLAGFIGILGFFSIRSQSDSLINIQNNRLPAMEAFSEINKQRMIIRSQTLEVMLAYNITNIVDFREELKNIEKNRKNSWEQVDKYWSVSESIERQSEEGKRLQAEIRAQYKAWRDIYVTLDGLIESMITANNNSLPALKEEYTIAYNKMVPISNTMGATFDLLKENNNQNTNKMVNADVKASLTSQNLILTAIVIAILLAVFLGFWISGNIQKIIRSVIGQTRQLADAAVAGRLATRAQPEETNEEFREIIVGINKTLDAVIGPLNVAAEYVDRISKGNIPEKITDNYNGDFNEIKNNLNVCIDALNFLITDVDSLSSAAIEGKLLTRADANKHQGGFAQLIEGINDTINSLVGYIDNMPTPAMIINKEYEVLFINKIGASLNSTTAETMVRNKTKCFDHFRTGDCKTSKCACTQAMSQNSESNSETDAHPGINNLDINYTAIPVKNKEGHIIGAFEVVSDITAIKQAARLAQKVADYQNLETKKITENLVMLSEGITTIVAKSGEADHDTLEAKQKFDTINAALTTCVQAVNSLIEDANTLAKAAVDGRLATRADASRHQGDFRKIVEGVNNTLDSVIGPLNVAALYVDKIAKGDMPELITDKYNGDFNNIKNNLNSLINAFNEIIAKARMVAQGDLTITLAKRSVNDELMGALSDMVARLSEIVGQVMEAAQNVATSSNEMSTSAVQISEGASEQSASAEEVSSSIEEMSSTIQQNSDNSITTEKIAVASAQGMLEVNGAAQKSLEAMRQISDKIRIINDIAGKTDILAINGQYSPGQ